MYRQRKAKSAIPFRFVLFHYHERWPYVGQRGILNLAVLYVTSATQSMTLKKRLVSSLSFLQYVLCKTL